MADGGYDIADYRAIDPSFGTLAEAERADRRGARAAASARSSTSSRTTSPTSTRGSRRRSPPRPARPSASGSGSARAGARRRRAAQRLAVDLRRRRLDPHDERGRHAGRVVPAPVRPRAARPQLERTPTSGASTRTCCGSGSTAASPACGSTRPRCWSRIRSCPRSARHRGRASTRTPTATSCTTIYRRWRGDRRLLRRAARARRRGLDARRRALRPLPAARRAAHRVQLRLPGLPVGCRRRCATRSSRRSPRTRRSGRPATWVLSNHDVTRPVTRYGRADTSFAFEAKRAGTPTDLALGTRRARAAALLAMALPGSLYIYQGEELGLPEVEDIPDDRRQDPMWLRSGGVDPGRDGCRVPLPWSGDRPPYGFSRDGRRAPWLDPPDDWAQLTVEAETRTPARCSRSTARACAYDAPTRGRGRPRSTGSPGPRRSSLRAGASGFICLVNFGPEPVPLPAGASVLLASNDLEGGLAAPRHDRLAAPDSAGARAGNAAHLTGHMRRHRSQAHETRRVAMKSIRKATRTTALRGRARWPCCCDVDARSRRRHSSASLERLRSAWPR